MNDKLSNAIVPPVNQEPIRKSRETCFLGKVPVGDKKQKKALIYSLWDGIFANGMVALVDTFAVAAAVYLHAPSIIIALLGSLPLLLSSIGQLFIPYHLDTSKGRKKYVITGTTIQSMALMLLGTSGWFPEKFRPYLFLLIFTLYGFSGNMTGGLWIAWMGDLVSPKIRGRHFAWRNRIFAITQLLCAITAGLIAREYSNDNASWIVFALIFFSASIFRGISTRFLALQYEPENTTNKRSAFPLAHLHKIKPFLFFSLASGLMQGSVALSGPFFNVWFVRDLHFDFFTLATATSCTIIGSIISLSFWGKLCDSIGNRKVLIITGFLISIVPLPYIFFHAPWQIWLFNLYTGISWGGYNLSNFNVVLAGAGKDRSDSKIIISIAINGICVFILGLIGGYLATRLPAILGWQLCSLFLLSAILRLTVFSFLFTRLPKFGELEK
jgi:MFS family permease